MSNNRDFLKTPEGRLDLYIASKELFNQYFSHPQIVERLEDYASDKDRLTVIVDAAMKETWDAIANQGIKLFALSWTREEIINKLSETESDIEIITLLVDNFYSRPIEYIDAKNKALRRVKKLFKTCIYLTGITAIFIIKDYDFVYLLIGVLIFEILLFFGLKAYFTKQIQLQKRRLIIFQRLKRAKLMTRIRKLFLQKKENVLSIYCTAGFPRLESTVEVIKSLQESGANMIELGIPYSDPLADGPVIQHSNSIALKNGMTIKKLFEQLKDFRKEISLPVLLMGYMNPILQYGFEKFCEEAASVGVDGLILPDLPEHEFETEYGSIIKKYGLDFVFLVTPETSDDRIKKLDELSTGFLYAISSSSTTGKEKNMNDVELFLQKLQQMQLKNPVLVGFGIKDKATFEAACHHANGAIIGTAYIKAIENAQDVKVATQSFLSSILQ